MILFYVFFVAGKNIMNPTRKPISVLGVGYSVGYEILGQQKRGHAFDVTPYFIMADDARLELATSGSGDQRSIHLS